MCSFALFNCFVSLRLVSFRFGYFPVPFRALIYLVMQFIPFRFVSIRFGYFPVMRRILFRVGVLLRFVLLNIPLRFGPSCFISFRFVFLPSPPPPPPFPGVFHTEWRWPDQWTKGRSPSCWTCDITPVVFSLAG